MSKSIEMSGSSVACGKRKGFIVECGLLASPIVTHWTASMMLNIYWWLVLPAVSGSRAHKCCFMASSVSVILLPIFALTPVPIRAHSRSLPLTATHSRSLLGLSTLTPAHCRSLPLTLVHCRSLPLTPARADARISMGELRKQSYQYHKHTETCMDLIGQWEIDISFIACLYSLIRLNDLRFHFLNQ